jgi:hypothetical protein
MTHEQQIALIEEARAARAREQGSKPIDQHVTRLL